jgi:hypothetical protein
LIPPPLNQLQMHHFYIYIHVYTLFAPYSSSDPFSTTSPLPTVAPSPSQTYSAFLFSDFVEKPKRYFFISYLHSFVCVYKNKKF